MISLIIPTYRNPEYLELCLRSAIENQVNKNQIIVAVDGYVEESMAVLEKYTHHINVLPFEQNVGMQAALNFAVMNATNEILCIINDDNVLCKDWDVIIEKNYHPHSCITINQIEPKGPSIFNFEIKDFGTTPSEFKYDEFIEYEQSIRKDTFTLDGGIFPFVLSKKNYMIVNGFDPLYQSPFICDWDFFLKLDLNGIGFVRLHDANFYHFGSSATKNGKEGDKFKATEGPAAQTFAYKWGIQPQLFENNSHRPKGKVVKGLEF